MNTSGAPLWACGQTHAHHQRDDHYSPQSRQHPATMAPTIARHAIHTYSNPGDTVLDPMCGIGTTAVEATRLGRHGYGADYEPYWTQLACDNLHRAQQHHPSANGQIWQGDATALTDDLPADLHGGIDLVVTSPPYGRHTHGYWPAGRTSQVIREGDTYSPHRHDRRQLANRSSDFTNGLLDVIDQCAQVLRVGGVLVLVARPYTHHRRLVHLPAILTTLAASTGKLHAIAHHTALTARWTGDGRLVAHHSFFKLHHTRRARASDRKPVLTAHEDVIAFRRSR